MVISFFNEGFVQKDRKSFRRVLSTQNCETKAIEDQNNRFWIRQLFINTPINE